MATVGGMPYTASTSGRPAGCTMLRAYALRLSKYRRCPSLNKMSNASVDLPEPDTPVMTLNLPRGMLTLKLLRLCSLALMI